MFSLEDYQEAVESNLRKIRLSELVVSEAHSNLVVPIYPEDKADLLIATERLAESAFLLLEQVREIVWEESKNQPSSES
jgi:hypothetical protein